MLRVGALGASEHAGRVLFGSDAAVEVLGAASTNAARLRSFADHHGIRRTYDRYDDLIGDPEIDAVYIALHNSAHAEWVCKAVAAGKSILVEKPFALSTEVIEAASACRTFVMEAIPPAHHPWQEAVRDLNGNAEFGNLLRIETRIIFRWPHPASYRWKRGLGGGIIWDAGPYWAQTIQAICGLGGVELAGVSSRRVFGSEVNTEVRCNVRWPNGVTSSLEAAFGDRHDAEHRFVFERGLIRHPRFLLPMSGVFRVNLHLVSEAGPARMQTFDPACYLHSQLKALVAGVSQRATGDWQGIGERIQLLQAVSDSAGAA